MDNIRIVLMQRSSTSSIGILFLQVTACAGLWLLDANNPRIDHVLRDEPDLQFVDTNDVADLITCPYG